MLRINPPRYGTPLLRSCEQTPLAFEHALFVERTTDRGHNAGRDEHPPFLKLTFRYRSVKKRTINFLDSL